MNAEEATRKITEEFNSSDKYVEFNVFDETTLDGRFTLKELERIIELRKEIAT